MPLGSPNLDDRTFHDLLVEAKARVAERCPQWTDHSLHDPGTILLEAFCHLTELMLFRLNRLPDKAYVELLRLIGVQRQPPSAAVARLEFRVPRPTTEPLEIPRGLRVTAASGDAPPVFSVGATTPFPAGRRSVTTLAYHARLAQAESVGHSNGQAGQRFRLQHRPVVAKSSEDLAVVVAVEAPTEDELAGGARMSFNGRAFRLWREVEHFSEVGPERQVFRVDRLDGCIELAPAVRQQERSASSNGPSAGRLSPRAEPQAAIPAAGREILVSYWWTEEPPAHVAADMLTEIKDGLSAGGVSVRNPGPSQGGRSAESLENALRRGPLELFTLERAVTARDYEALARRNSGVERARAFTARELWTHAATGSVEVVLVPSLSQPQRVTQQTLSAAQSESVRAQVQSTLEEKSPAGTTCRVSWARYKSIQVRAEVVAYPHADLPGLRHSLQRRLERALSPLPALPQRPGWGFGQALKASHVYAAILAEPGVAHAEHVRFEVDQVPDQDVHCLVHASGQPSTWYATSGPRLFRSNNDAESWELVHEDERGQARAMAVHAEEAHLGWVAAAIHRSPQGPARLLLSRDGGETWRTGAILQGHTVSALAWTVRGRSPVLLVATSRGLYRLFVDSSAGPELLVVDGSDPNRGIDAVAVAYTARERRFIAVAPAGSSGVLVSDSMEGEFAPTGLGNHDVRVLRVQHDGLRSFLWAGASAIGDEPGTGCSLMELLDEPRARQWQHFSHGWSGGSCHDLCVSGAWVYAASHDAGVMSLDLRQGRDAEWRASDLDSGLPLSQKGLQPVRALAARAEAPADAGTGSLLLAGGSAGVFRSTDLGRSWDNRARRVFAESVPLPRTWLFCSGEHALDLRTEEVAL